MTSSTADRRGVVPPRVGTGALVGALVALVAVLALAAPVAGQVGGGLGQPTDPERPVGGGIGERPGGGRTTQDPDAGDDPGTTAPADDDEKPATPLGRSAADDSDDDGTSVVALAAVGFGGLIVGVVLAGIPLGAALARSRRRAPAPVTRAPVPSGPTPPPAPGPVVGPAPSREEAQARSQRAALAESLMALRDQLTSAALVEEAARALASVGIAEVRPDGQPFDPARHRAVDQVQVDDPARHNTVASTERPGYADGDRLVRLPEVVVARHGSGS